jgi:hypothetical protein
MADIKLEIEGEGAIVATRELLQIPGVTGNWQPSTEEPEREAILVTIATIIGITAGALEIAEKIYAWYHHRHKQALPEQQIDKVILIGRNGQRILLANATVEQIRQILES